MGEYQKEYGALPMRARVPVNERYRKMQARAVARLTRDIDHMVDADVLMLSGGGFSRLLSEIQRRGRHAALHLVNKQVETDTSRFGKTKTELDRHMDKRSIDKKKENGAQEGTQLDAKEDDNGIIRSTRERGRDLARGLLLPNGRPRLFDVADGVRICYVV